MEGKKYMPYNILEKMKLEATFSKKSGYDQTKQNVIKIETGKILIKFKNCGRNQRLYCYL